MRPRTDAGQAASSRGTAGAAAARILGHAVAAACLCGLAACATTPDAGALIDLHLQAVTLQRPAAYQAAAGAQPGESTHYSSLQEPPADSLGYTSRN